MMRAVLLATFLAQEPYRISVCLVKSGPKGQDMSTNVWNDQLEAKLGRVLDTWHGSC